MAFPDETIGGSHADRVLIVLNRDGGILAHSFPMMSAGLLRPLQGVGCPFQLAK
jgi:hypothetical protein